VFSSTILYIKVTSNPPRQSYYFHYSDTKRRTNTRGRLTGLLCKSHHHKFLLLTSSPRRGPRKPHVARLDPFSFLLSFALFTFQVLDYPHHSRPPSSRPLPCLLWPRRLHFTPGKTQQSHYDYNYNTKHTFSKKDGNRIAPALYFVVLNQVVDLFPTRHAKSQRPCVWLLPERLLSWLFPPKSRPRSGGRCLLGYSSKKPANKFSFRTTWCK
jgi:hypothetical protein